MCTAAVLIDCTPDISRDSEHVYFGGNLLYVHYSTALSGAAEPRGPGGQLTPLFQVRGPHMDVDPSLMVRISRCMNAADNTIKLSDQ